jgi:hypothetical protein
MHAQPGVLTVEAAELAEIAWGIAHQLDRQRGQHLGLDQMGGFRLGDTHEHTANRRRRSG